MDSKFNIIIWVVVVPLILAAITIVVGCSIAIVIDDLVSEYTYKTEQGSFGSAERCYTIRGELLCDSGSKTIKVIEYERTDK